MVVRRPGRRDERPLTSRRIHSTRGRACTNTGAAAFRSVAGHDLFLEFRRPTLIPLRWREDPQAITPEAEMRYADGVIDRRRNRMICVREDPHARGAKRSTQSSGFL